jgi:hypothetical protein
VTAFQNKENVMKNQEQANNNNHLNDSTAANDPQAQVEFDDLQISSEQEEQVKGGATTTASFKPGVLMVVGDNGPQRTETESSSNWTRVSQSH